MEAILNYITHHLKGFANRICKSKADAEDLVQDTCERMIMAGDRYGDLPLIEQKKISVVMMKRIMIDKYRKQQARPRLTNELSFDVAGSDDVGSWFEYKHIMGIISSSTDKHIQVFYQSLMGYKMKEISKMNNYPLGTATGNARYGRNKLKAMLADQRLAS